MASLCVMEKDGRIKVELDSYSTDKRVKDVSWALTPDGLDLQQVAEEFGYIPLKEVRVQTKGVVLNWPLEWKHTRVVECKAANCPSQIFSPYLTGMTLEVPELPPFFHRCLHLGGVNVVELQNMNSLKNLLEAPLVDSVGCYWTKAPKAWPTEIRGPSGLCVIGDHHYKWKTFESMHKLRLLVIQGLSSVRRWRKWLTRGLYDPRLLQTIASFIAPVILF